MGAWVDHTGKVFGCKTVVSRAETVILPGGHHKAKWNVRCVCGYEEVVGARAVAHTNPKSCASVKCSLRWDTPKSAVCVECGAPREIAHKESGRRQQRCCVACAKLAHVALGIGRGKPAPNRLPNSEGAFNLLYGSYIRGARIRKIEFSIPKEEFRRLTKEDCSYCGTPPAAIRKSSKSLAPGYVYNGLDRADSSEGYTLDNVVPCCGVCNYMKQELSVASFLAKVAAVYAHSVEAAGA